MAPEALARRGTATVLLDGDARAMSTRRRGGGIGSHALLNGSAAARPPQLRGLDSIQEGLSVFRGLGKAWWIAYGLAYRSALEASRGDLATALATSDEALQPALRHGVGYPLALARTHALWQREVLEPGRPERTPEIEAALTDAERLGLRGAALHLRWVRLLPRTADPAVADGALAREVAESAQGVSVPPRGRVPWSCCSGRSTASCGSGAPPWRRWRGPL
jgi:hypothetical protein